MLCLFEALFLICSLDDACGAELGPIPLKLTNRKTNIQVLQPLKINNSEKQYNCQTSFGDLKKHKHLIEQKLFLFLLLESDPEIK